MISVNASAAIGNVVVTTAAGFERGLPAKGSIAAIFCTGLEGINGVIATEATPLPREIAGVKVRVGGVGAPIFAIAALAGYQQINIQVPQEAVIHLPTTFPSWPVGSDDAFTDVVIEQGGQSTSAIVVVRKSPGDFFELEGGFAVLQHASDYSLVTSENPARPEEMIIAYLTGLPGTRPVVATGILSPVPPAIVPQISQPQVDNYNLIILLPPNNIAAISPDFAGLTPGLIGVYQINFKLSDQSALFGNRPLAVFNAEFYLVRSLCTAFCGNPASHTRFSSKLVRIPIAPKK